MENIAILGSTGSIGQSTFGVVDRLKHRFSVVGLAAGRNTRLLQEQIEKYKPKIVSLERKEEAEELRRKCDVSSLRITFGQDGAEEVASFEESDIVISAITGINGLRPTVASIKAGKKVALANKESMVVAGPLIKALARKSGSQIIPVDSEHSGVFQCLAKERKEFVKRVVLTASGGPFFRTALSEMKKKTVEEALKHPRWEMGKKVTIDSATLMNKGLELIEARWFFDLQPKQLEILIHPQSIVHSLVEMNDGSVLAQPSPTDMKIPIQYALTYPERENGLLPSLDLSKIKALEFFEVDQNKFPLVSLSRRALEEGDSFPVALNAANEVVVGDFLKNRLKFLDISDVIKSALNGHKKRKIESLEDIFEVDWETRAETLRLLKERF
ncbi:MAG: 1-deoxy-D-xylulose-5-phosphate reductoisomerase [Candidatus Aminicenantes bacterium]|nr:MAG: 1-deoxy-D-xylulose-5-phosphate reductoisomerase [Candidatus Aminicenantes bacterium]